MHGATPPLSHVFMVWFLIKNRNNFTITLPYLSVGRSNLENDKMPLGSADIPYLDRLQHKKHTQVFTYENQTRKTSTTDGTLHLQ
jgi:hypothetical protein